MVRRLFMILFILILFSGMMLQASALKHPTTLGAPEHFGVSHDEDGYCFITFNVPDDLRAYINARAQEDPEDSQEFQAHFQVDYRIDNGNWHYTKDWDNPGYIDVYMTFTGGDNHMDSANFSIRSMFPEDEALEAFQETGDDFLKKHTITFRVRFAETFDDGTTYVFSPWSEDYTLSSEMPGDPVKMIQHAPILKAVTVKTNIGFTPHLQIKTDSAPGDIQDLHAITGGKVMTEIWVRMQGKDEFINMGLHESDLGILEVKASDIFGYQLNDYEQASYEMKIRYALELKNYKQSGRNDTIYGPFSNVISHNMPSWSKASQWALAEINKAVANNLYPDKINGADLTRPITRAEFAAVTVKLYEALSGKSAFPAPASTFTDTKDSDILKAYNLDIVGGVGNNKFAPDEYVNREQAATMLTRVYKKLNWEGWTLAGDSNYTAHSLDNKGVTPFADDRDISVWAKPSVYFMAKYEIIKGLGGNKFAPRNITSADMASGYANATCEQALIISNRTFEKVDSIQDGGSVVGTPASPTPAVANDDKQMAEWIVGTWAYGTSNGNTLMDFMYVFNKDGSFYNIISSAWMGYRTGTSYSGKYKISGNKLILFDLLKSTGHVTSERVGNIWFLAMDSYETRDIPAADMEHQIKKTEDGLLMIDESSFTRGE